MSQVNKPPHVMATQHPDNASGPFWQKTPFITCAKEINESFICFNKLKIDEYNWDWEGKYADESVIDKLFAKHTAFFSKRQLGRDIRLTFRIPNPRVEKEYRLARVFMVLAASGQLAKSYGFFKHPVFECILPLTENAKEIIEIQKGYADLIDNPNPILAMEYALDHLSVIPLFEQVEKIIDSDKIIREYLELHQKFFSFQPKYIRPYLARSDPALNSGLISIMAALKIAISRYIKMEKEIGIKLYPMVGTGCLPFRGGVTPEAIDKAMQIYAGFHTLTVQSAFRYDYSLAKVMSAIDILNRDLGKHKGSLLSLKDEKILEDICLSSQKRYRLTVSKITNFINRISVYFPRRRERIQHIGLFGYARGLNGVSLPRAIPFTGSLYSIGVPPEFIGAGNALENMARAGNLERFMDTVSGLSDFFLTAGRYINYENLEKLAKVNSSFEDIYSDILKTAKILKISFSPITEKDREHRIITSKILDTLSGKGNISYNKIQSLITASGVLRQSLG